MSAPQTPIPTPAPTPPPPTVAPVPTLPTVATTANPSKRITVGTEQATSVKKLPTKNAAASSPVLPQTSQTEAVSKPPLPKKEATNPVQKTPPPQTADVVAPVTNAANVPGAVSSALPPKAKASLLSSAATPKTAEKADKVQAKVVKKAKSAYLKANLSRIFGRLRRHVLFFIVCALFLFSSIWIFARAWQQEKAGENDNWFHEGLFLVVMVAMLTMFYYRLYRKSEVYQSALIKREAAEKAAREARLKLEEEQKKQAFMGLIKDFQSANSYEQKSATMAKLLTVGLESNLLRQQAIDLLCDLNAWMADHVTFLSGQNLITWRLKGSLFEQSERFQVDSATQDLSIKSVNIIEAIVKKHLTEFHSGRTQTQLDLSDRTIPTLTLTAQNINGDSVKFAGSNLWQASFAETKLSNLSFAGCNLQSASFWRAQLENIDMQDANLNFSKLRTNLQTVQHLTASQFFASKEWELCYLSPEQQAEFFADPEAIPPGAKSNWDSAEPRRRKLYFHLLRQQADAL
jgi:hypothetical protein